MSGEKERVVAADVHVHLYPRYDISVAIHSLMKNLGSAAAASRRAALLVERSDCDAFRDMRQGRLHPGREGLAFQPCREEGAVALFEEGEPVLFLFGGRQVVSSEGVEVLGLLTGRGDLDGKPAGDVAAAILDDGGVPVISWAPGKWLGRRGVVVEAVLARFGPGKILLGDTVMRPKTWVEPKIMRRARREGFRVVAGSDALPFAGEERYLGSYLSLFEGPFDAARPVEGIRNLLNDPGALKGTAGYRCSLLDSGRRLIRSLAAKKRGA